MTVELVVAGGFVLIVLGAIGLAVYLAFRSGGKNEKIDQLKEDKKDANKQLDRRTDPVLSDAEYRDRLRRAQERFARLQNRKTKQKRS